MKKYLQSLREYANEQEEKAGREGNDTAFGFYLGEKKIIDTVQSFSLWERIKFVFSYFQK